MTERLPVDPRSPVYQEFSRLYGIAHAMRPPVRRDGGGWNGELYAHTGAWGSVHPKTGAMSLHHERVLPYLTGTQSMTSPGKQAQALQTVLHEYYHQRVGIDAPREPNAIRSRESKALDEGLTEYQAKKDVDAFADRAGYGDVVSDDHAYRAAYEASAQMLAYAAPDPQRRDLLAQRALDQPVVMRWDAVGDEIVHSRLDGVVPRDPQHQQAARAALVHAMAHPGWQFLEEARKEKSGRNVADHTRQRLDAAIADIGRHYADLPSRPYPAAPLNPEAALQQGGQQRRTFSRDERQPTQQLQSPVQRAAQRHGSRPEVAQHGLPQGQTPQRRGQPPAPQHGGGRPQQLDPAMRAAFAGNAPAAGATGYTPSLGDGARGTGRQSPGRGLTPPGRDDRS